MSLLHRYCYKIISSGGCVLELGCGAGANIQLFRAIGMKYYAVDGSPTIVTQLHDRYPDLAQKIWVGDFTLDLSFSSRFDLVIDRASLTHNNSAAFRRALSLDSKSLKLGGYFVGSDWFSKSHSDFSGGDYIDDENTKFNHKVGQFVGTGRVRFSDEEHLMDLFSDYEIVFLEEKQSRRYVPTDGHLFASWNIVARKPDA